jgi:hypothetical protein
MNSNPSPATHASLLSPSYRPLLLLLLLLLSVWMSFSTSTYHQRRGLWLVTGPSEASNEERETGDRSSSFLTIPLSVVPVHLPLSVSTPHRAERRCHRHDTSKASQSDWRQRQRPETISSSLAWEDWQRLVEGNCLCILSSQALSHQQGREH